MPLPSSQNPQRPFALPKSIFDFEDEDLGGKCVAALLAALSTINDAVRRGGKRGTNRVSSRIEDFSLVV